MQTLPAFKANPITLDLNQDRLNASITHEEKNPYQYGTLENSFRVKSAFIGRRGLKSSGSTRSVNRTRNTIECKSTQNMAALKADYKGMNVK